MARMVVLAVLLATVFTLASPFPSQAGFRSGFVTGFPVATFSRPLFAPFATSVVVVNRSFVSFTPSGFPVQRVFVREVIVPQAPVVVLPVQRVIVISQPVFVTLVRPIFVSSQCFFDQFGALRCVP
jgi:hypothetical protein